MKEDLTLLKEKFPFLTLFDYGENTFIGIIANCGPLMTSVYLYNSIKNPAQKKEFAELGELWWYESNRKIPIDVFLKGDMEKFNFCVKSFVSKEIKIIQGPKVQIEELRQKRVKKKRISIKKHLKK